MNQLHGVVYPVTYMGSTIMGRLSQIFHRFTILVPAEDCTPSGPAFKPDGIILSPVTPSPFGERLSWFNGFIDSITGWARDVGLGKGLDAQPVGDSLKDDESISAIIDALGKDGHKDPLLEAQIFLRLAHDLDQKEDDAEQDLTRLKMKESVLKDILHGATLGPDESSKPGPESSETIAPVSMPLKRLAAWSELWTRAGVDIHGALPIGVGIDVKDLMDKAYESLINDPATDLLTLKLPNDPSAGLKMWPDMEKGLEDLITAISVLTKEASERPQREAGDAVDQIKQGASRLSELWDSLTVGMEYGPTLGLSLYPKVSFGELLFKASGRRPPASQDNTYIAHVDRAGSSFYLY